MTRLSPHQRDDRNAPTGETSAPSIEPDRPRIVRPNGAFDVVCLGVQESPWRDLYHWLLVLPWGGFLLLTALTYLLVNAGFAALYLIGGNHIANARPGSFADAFFFSIQTMASIGYGLMHPQTTYAHLVVTLEALTGLMILAVVTGLMFARFSRPTAKVIFSQVAILTRYQGVPTLMFRCANRRRNRILEAQLRLILLRNETTSEGHSMRRFYDLALVRSHSPTFALTWTAMHPIDENSPLHGLDQADLDALRAEIIVTLVGLDETFSQTIHARHSYMPSEILRDVQFVDLFTQTEDGRFAIDYSKFHLVIPVKQ